jgi:ATP-dependent protease ClpP protease subunit
MKKSEIKITNSKSGTTTIDIEGTIGVPEEWQFEEPAGRVATYEKFRRTLAAISRIKDGEVVVNIRSTGGDVGDALLIYEALAGLDAKITTRCYGYVASAATIIAQAASEGRRELSADSLYLVHNSIGTCEGNARDLRQSEELLVKTDERIAAIYARRSGRGETDFAALMSENNGGGRWLSPEEALAEGLADRIIEAEDGARKNRRPLAANSADADAVRRQQNVEIERLSHRIESLESENALLRARPTLLKTKEDPSPTESRRSANEIAYERDAESFQNH